MIRTIEIEYLFDSQMRTSNETPASCMVVIRAVSNYRYIRDTECEKRLIPLTYRLNPCARYVFVFRKRGRGVMVIIINPGNMFLTLPLHGRDWSSEHSGCFTSR